MAAGVIDESLIIAARAVCGHYTEHDLGHIGRTIPHFSSQHVIWQLRHWHNAADHQRHQRGRITALPRVLLGPFAFDLITYLESIEQRVEAAYAELVVFGGKPRLQCVGDKLDADTWQIVLHDEFCSPTAEIAKLEAAMQAHAALPLIFANGDYRGWFVPVELTETYRTTTPMWMEATLQLKEHVLSPVLVTQKRNPGRLKSLPVTAKRRSPHPPQKRKAPKRARTAPVCARE